MTCEPPFHDHWCVASTEPSRINVADSEHNLLEHDGETDIAETLLTPQQQELLENVSLGLGAGIVTGCASGVLLGVTAVSAFATPILGFASAFLF